MATHLNVDQLRKALVGKTISGIERVGDWDDTDGYKERMREILKVSCSDGSDVFLSAGNDFDSQAYCLPCIVELDDKGAVVDRMADGSAYSAGSWVS